MNLFWNLKIPYLFFLNIQSNTTNVISKSSNSTSFDSTESFSTVKVQSTVYSFLTSEGPGWFLEGQFWLTFVLYIRFWIRVSLTVTFNICIMIFSHMGFKSWHFVELFITFVAINSFTVSNLVLMIFCHVLFQECYRFSFELTIFILKIFSYFPMQCPCSENPEIAG